MAAKKIHVFAGQNDGTVSADYRLSPIGKSQGDEHRTIFEIDPIPQVAETVAALAAKEANRKIQEALKEFCNAMEIDYADAASKFHIALGGDGSATVFGIRAGIWPH